ncbi:MAG: PEP-utilizing enzyme, partial [Candidatus Micrarchaeota archaeon]|nr:PEP-utilizing enzyme [Candidatus Micrarchaeota archaeon]
MGDRFSKKNPVTGSLHATKTKKPRNFRKEIAPTAVDSFQNGTPAYSSLRAYVPRSGDYLGSQQQAKEVLGGKGAGLCDMISLGLNVPPAAIIPTTECEAYYNAGKKTDESLRQHVRAAVVELEAMTGKSFFDYDGGKDLLLVSIRSGAKISMPGMMETVLNVGLTDARVEQMLANGEDPRFVFDLQRRFYQYYGSVVCEVGIEKIEDKTINHYELALEAARKKYGAKTDSQLPAEALAGLAGTFKDIIYRAGGEIPQDPFEQVIAAVEAVFRSSYNDKAMIYKEKNGLPLEMPTAVNIQTMAYGNRNGDSGSGVLFTRHKNTGDAHAYSDYLVNAQGEEVVSGSRTPVNFTSGSKKCPLGVKLGKELFRTVKRLEKHYRDMLDIEYTVENGKLYFLQVRTGKRSGKAAFKIACDLVDEGMITKEEAIKRITFDNVLSVLLPQIDPAAKKGITADAKGAPASAGAACGAIYFSASKIAKIAEDATAAGKTPPAMLLLSNMTKPEDYHGMIAAGRNGGGVLTVEGGATSHAAVVCGGNGIPAVVGCGALKLDIESGYAIINGKKVKQGEMVTIDGATGEVFVGELKLVPPELTADFKRVIGWANGISQLPIMANADTPAQARQALELGAKGIGLCRTEHMFNDKSRIGIVQEMFLAKTPEERQEFIDQLLPMQREDFRGILSEMSGKPVTIRLLDPPMHEFLPDLVELERAQAARKAKGETNAEQDALLERVRFLHEENPMLGVRGVRLLQQYPEILDMQVKAIINGALDAKEQGGDPHVKIMVPVVMESSEFA